MSDHPKYLTDESTVDTVYRDLQSGRLDSAVAFIKSKGDDKAVMSAWIGVQCDINNVKGDPYLSEAIAREGVKFALDRNFKRGAAILLHNVSSFYMKNFDEDVDPKVIPGIIQAAEQQVELREQITGDNSSLAWAYWDKGTALLAGGKPDKAVQAFEQGVLVAEQMGDADAVAWARLFIGKALLKFKPDRKSDGEKLMKKSAAIIREIGEDWEKEEVSKILKTVGIG